MADAYAGMLKRKGTGQRGRPKKVPRLERDTGGSAVFEDVQFAWDKRVKGPEDAEEPKEAANERGRKKEKKSYHRPIKSQYSTHHGTTVAILVIAPIVQVDANLMVFDFMVNDLL